MRYVSFVAIALSMAFSCATASAAVDADSGTILFTRPVTGTYNGAPSVVGSGLFLIHDNGTGFRQLTPMAAGSYYFPSGVAYDGSGPSIHSGTWLTRNFSPNGRYIQYFEAHLANPVASGPYPGKYDVKDLHTGATSALFRGANDNNPPGYGYLAWGPAGSNEIAYTNSTSELTTSTPCVGLMHPDGSDAHTLWCAPATISLPQGSVPSLAVSQIRWSGNGKRLLAYVSYQPVPLALPKRSDTAPTVGGSGFAALFVVNVQTGASRMVAPDVADDPALGDISYNGNVVLYQQPDLYSCGDINPESQGLSLCAMNLTTGAVTTLLPANDWYLQGTDLWYSPWFYPTARLSPDGSKAAVTMVGQNATVFQADLYILNTDGSGISRALTSRPANTPAGNEIAWIPVAWSPDGRQLLVNHLTTTSSGTFQQAMTSSEVHVFAVSNARDWRVTSGYAVDWLKQY